MPPVDTSIQFSDDERFLIDNINLFFRFWIYSTHNTFSKLYIMNRRQFLGNSTKQLALLNLAAVAPAGLLTRKDQESLNPSYRKEEIHHRVLGRTDIEVPIVGMGVMNASVPNVVKQAYLKGMRFFDTAWFYQNGRNETMVGEVFDSLGVRSEVTICTKVFLKEIDRDLYQPGIKQLFLDRFEQSLKRLKMDYTDILLYHAAGETREFENPYIIEAFEELKKAGKVKFAGVSLHGDDAAMLDDLANKGYYDVAMVIFNVALANDQRLLNSMQNAASKGMGLIAMKTQCGDGGYMWWNRKDAPPNEEHFNLNQTALLKWVLQYPFIATAIPGFTTFEQLEENFSVNLDLKMNEEELSFLEKNSVNMARSFCIRCNKCIKSCPQYVNIPEIMRTWMYAFQYRNMEQARLTAKTLGTKGGLNPCSECDICTASCARGINIANRVNGLKSINLEFA